MYFEVQWSNIRGKNCKNILNCYNFIKRLLSREADFQIMEIIAFSKIWKIQSRNSGKFSSWSNPDSKIEAFPLQPSKICCTTFFFILWNLLRYLFSTNDNISRFVNIIGYNSEKYRLAVPIKKKKRKKNDEK